MEWVVWIFLGVVGLFIAVQVVWAFLPGKSITSEVFLADEEATEEYEIEVAELVPEVVVAEESPPPQTSISPLTRMFFKRAVKGLLPSRNGRNGDWHHYPD